MPWPCSATPSPSRSSAPRMFRLTPPIVSGVVAVTAALRKLRIRPVPPVATPSGRMPDGASAGAAVGAGTSPPPPQALRLPAPARASQWRRVSPRSGRRGVGRRIVRLQVMVVVGEQAQAGPVGAGAAGGLIGCDQALQLRDQLGAQPNPLRAGQVADGGGGLLAEFIGIDGLLEVAAVAVHDIGGRSGEVVADVGAEETEHLRIVLRGGDPFGVEMYGLAIVRQPHQAQAQHLVEQAARVHMAGDGLRKAVEAGCRAGSRQGQGLVARAPVIRMRHPVGVGAAGWRRALGRQRGQLTREAGDLAAAQAGGGGDAAHVAARRVAGLARGPHKRALEQFLRRRMRQAVGDAQARQGHEQGLESGE
mmetsp:Transcript_41089/g.114329  ORF Transcript_41089/g.114329 Transcript_41089/m.114329 type:complete len:364 (-) Transcript_41089:1154-2245(-)